eukprot:15467437-Alexandrium_andersonii.AAC.1
MVTRTPSAHVSKRAPIQTTEEPEVVLCHAKGYPTRVAQRRGDRALPSSGPEAAARDIQGVIDVDGEPERRGVDEHRRGPPEPGGVPTPH